MCDQYDETIDHLTSGCHVIHHAEYKIRHSRVGQYIHCKICQKCNGPHKKSWYEHKPQLVLKTDNVTVLWNFVIQTSRKIDTNKSDIPIKDHRNNSCVCVDGVWLCWWSLWKRTCQLENLVIYKYKDLEIEIEQMWYLKPKLIPVFVEALGTVKNEKAIFRTNSWFS